MNMSGCVEGILVDLSEPVQEPTGCSVDKLLDLSGPDRGHEDSVELFRDDKDNNQLLVQIDSPLLPDTNLVEGLRTKSPKLDFSSKCNDSPPILTDTIESETFDFDLPLTPSTVSERSSSVEDLAGKEEEEEEVFFGPVGFHERCVATVVDSATKSAAPLSPLNERMWAKLKLEAQKVVDRIQSSKEKENMVQGPPPKKPCVEISALQPKEPKKRLFKQCVSNCQQQEPKITVLQPHGSTCPPQTQEPCVRTSPPQPQETKLKPRSGLRAPKGCLALPSKLKLPGNQPVSTTATTITMAPVADSASSDITVKATSTSSNVPAKAPSTVSSIPAKAASSSSNIPAKAASSSSSISAKAASTSSNIPAKAASSSSNVPAKVLAKRSGIPGFKGKNAPISKLQLMKPSGLQKPTVMSQAKAEEVPKKTGPMKAFNPAVSKAPGTTEKKEAKHVTPAKEEKRVRPKNLLSSSFSTPKSGSTSSMDSPASSVNKRRSFLPTPNKTRAGSTASAPSPSVSRLSSTSSVESPLVGSTRKRRPSSTTKTGVLIDFDDSSPSAMKPKRPLVTNTPNLPPKRKVSPWSPVIKQKLDLEDQAIMCTKKIRK